MKKYYLYINLSLLFFSTNVTAEENGKHLMKKLCSSCHVTEGKPTLAPPIFAMKSHVKRAYTNRNDFVQRIIDWVEEPDAAIALMPGAVNRFGLMPKLSYKEEEVRKIAEYIYDTKIKLPEWYQKHYKQKHGDEPNQ
ncbi:MAG: cytochrome c [Sulfuriflexus sp.]|nr:cytochrome c [Sulfuriflexus sp.]